MRAKIEASGRDARWEFDRKRLFERTDHMASICEDLKEVATVMEEFYNIFGPELKAVTGDPKRIEDVLKRVDGLVKPIENVRFILLSDFVSAFKFSLEFCILVLDDFAVRGKGELEVTN